MRFPRSISSGATAKFCCSTPSRAQVAVPQQQGNCAPVARELSGRHGIRRIFSDQRSFVGGRPGRKTASGPAPEWVVANHRKSLSIAMSCRDKSESLLAISRCAHATVPVRCWPGTGSRNWFEVQDWQTEMWFSAGYKAEHAAADQWPR
jgi:hypothetical protein